MSQTNLQTRYIYENDASARIAAFSSLKTFKPMSQNKIDNRYIFE